MCSLISFYNKELIIYKNKIDYLVNKNKELYKKIYDLVQEIKYYDRILLDIDDAKIDKIKHKKKECNKYIDEINTEIFKNERDIYINYPLYIEKTKESIEDKIFINKIKKYYYMHIIGLIFFIIIIKLI